MNRRLALLAGVVLVSCFLLRNMLALGHDALAPSPAPGPAYPSQGTVYDGTSCNAYTRHAYDMQTVPSKTPDDGSWFSCWPGYVEGDHGPRGSSYCINVYNGKRAPPQKFTHTGGQWYGCSFGAGTDLWTCPTCSA